MIEYLHKQHYLNVVDVKPAFPKYAISIMEADVNLEFDTPLDYKPNPQSDPVSAVVPANTSLPSVVGTPPKTQEIKKEPVKSTFQAFSGEGYSLKKSTPPSNPNTSIRPTNSENIKKLPTSVPNTKSSTKKRVVDEDSDSEPSDEEDNKKFKPFGGTGYTLSGKKS